MNLRKLRTGNHVELVVDPEKRTVQEMEVPLDDNIVRAKTTPQGWTVEREEIPWTPVTRVIGYSQKWQAVGRIIATLKTQSKYSFDKSSKTYQCLRLDLRNSPASPLRMNRKQLKSVKIRRIHL